MSTIASLPLGPISEIVRGLNVFDLFALCRTDRSMRNACRNNQFWSLYARSKDIRASDQRDFIFSYFGIDEIGEPDVIYNTILSLIATEINEKENEEPLFLFQLDETIAQSLNLNDSVTIRAYTYGGAILILSRHVLLQTGRSYLDTLFSLIYDLAEYEEEGPTEMELRLDMIATSGLQIMTDAIGVNDLD